jgi:predicted dehydrogenase
MRYMDFTNCMRDIARSGVIGEVKAIWCRHFISYGGDAYFRDWHADREKTTSLLLQKGAHDIDIIHWIADSVTTRVQGFGTSCMYKNLPRRPEGKERLDCLTIQGVWTKDHWPAEACKDFYPNINNEDINMINMQLANGVQACYMQCHFTPDACRNYTIIGTKGRIENYGDCGKGASVQVCTQRVYDFRLEGDISYHLTGKDSDHGGADPKIIQGYIDMLRGKESPASTPQGARYAVAAGVLGAQSIRNGGMPYEVPALTEELENCDFSFLKN